MSRIDIAVGAMARLLYPTRHARNIRAIWDHRLLDVTVVVLQRVQIARRHIRGGFGSDEHGVQFEQAQWSLDGAQEGGYAVPARALDANDKFFQSGELRQRDEI